MRIRAERERDYTAIRLVNEAAFDTAAEANLVGKLRKEARPFVSLVAEEKGSVIGHIAFSPVTLAGHHDLRMMALAPMAVVPGEQRKGVGSALVWAGLEECRKLGAGAVALIGHPGYYPRFGFEPGSTFDLTSEFDAPPEAFMVIELLPGYFRNASGTIKFHEVFNDV